MRLGLTNQQCMIPVGLINVHACSIQTKHEDFEDFYIDRRACQWNTGNEKRLDMKPRRVQRVD